MLKKTLVILLSLTFILVLSIPAFANQNITVYAGIPRPEPTEQVKYIVTQNNDRTSARVYMISVNSIASLEANITFIAAPKSHSQLAVYCFTNGIPFNLSIICFDLNGQFIYSLEHPIGNASDYPNPFLVFDAPEHGHIDLFDIPLQDPYNKYSWSKPSIAWNDTIDPNSYYTLLSQILGAIQSNNQQSQNQTDEIVSNQTQNKDEIVSNQNQNTDEIVSNQNQNTDEIVSNQNQIQENEKNEANSSGNDGVNSIVGGIENKGEGFFNSMGNLISVMSYNGTDCKWTLPPITLPKIDGVMDSITLTDNLEIDFEYWIGHTPSTIMRVVQAISTIALILFCVKELYSVLSYVFTLRGG